MASPTEDEDVVQLDGLREDILQLSLARRDKSRPLPHFLDRQGSTWERPYWTATPGHKHPAAPPSEMPSLSKTVCTADSEVLEIPEDRIMVPLSPEMVAANINRGLSPAPRRTGTRGPNIDSNAKLTELSLANLAGTITPGHRQMTAPPSELPSLLSTIPMAPVEVPGDHILHTPEKVAAKVKCECPMHEEPIALSPRPLSWEDLATAPKLPSPSQALQEVMLPNMETGRIVTQLPGPLPPIDEFDTGSDWETIDGPPSRRCLTPSSSNGTASFPAAPTATVSQLVLDLKYRITRSSAWLLNTQTSFNGILSRILAANGGASQGVGVSAFGGNSSTDVSEKASGNSSKSNASEKRPWAPPGGDQGGGEDEIGGDENKRSRVEVGAPAKRFACPFQKAHLYSKIDTHCGIPNRQNPFGGFEHVRRVKEHVLTRHNPALRCNNCWKFCKTEGEAQEHHTDEHCSSVEICEYTLMQTHQVKEFRNQKFKGKGKPHQREADKWYNLMECLYPNFSDANLGTIRECYTPYYEHVNTDGLQLYQLVQGLCSNSGSGSGSELPMQPSTGGISSESVIPQTDSLEDYPALEIDWSMDDFPIADPLSDPHLLHDVPPSHPAAAEGDIQLESNSTKDLDPTQILLGILQRNSAELRAEVQQHRALLEMSRMHAYRLSGLSERLAVEFELVDGKLVLGSRAASTLGEISVATRDLVNGLS